MTFARSNITRLRPYVPGEQPADASPAIIKLNTNENPYPPSPGVIRAIRDVTPETLRLYPCAAAATFRQTAAALHGVDPDQVIATNGGDELLRLLLTVFCEPGSKGQGVGVTDPTYSLYHVLAQIHDTPVTCVARHSAFELPDDYIDQLNQARCRLALLVNPHAPTGRLENVERIRTLAQAFEGVLVVDEAYIDFALDPAHTLSLIQGDDALPNLVLLRSLSKGYSLAGLRFGYGLAHRDLIASLDKARDSYNTDAISQVAAVAALQDQPYLQQTRSQIIAQRTRLTQALRQRSYAVPDSHTNFVLAAVPPDGPDARAIYQCLKNQHILVRYFNLPGLEDKLRITVGSPEQVDALLNQLDKLHESPS